MPKATIPDEVIRLFNSEKAPPQRVELPGPGQYELPLVIDFRESRLPDKGPYLLKLVTEQQEILWLPIQPDAIGRLASYLGHLHAYWKQREQEQ